MPEDGVPSSEKEHTVRTENKSEESTVNGDTGLRPMPEKKVLQKKPRQR